MQLVLFWWTVAMRACRTTKGRPHSTAANRTESGMLSCRRHSEPSLWESKYFSIIESSSLSFPNDLLIEMDVFLISVLCSVGFYELNGFIAEGLHEQFWADWPRTSECGDEWSIERQGRGTNVSRGESDEVGVGLGRGSGCGRQWGRRGQGTDDFGRGPGTRIQHLLKVDWQLAAAAQSRWRGEVWKEKESEELDWWRFSCGKW